MSFASQFLQDLDKRGFLYQCTDFDELDKAVCGSERFAFYVGFDPTAKSLHVGHLLWIKLVDKLQKFGLNPIVICGGATSKIGDPTWKDKQRVALGDDVVVANTKSILEKLNQLIRFENCENSVKLLNNYSWLSELNYLEFLRDFGSLFSVNKMLAMDSVSTRLQRQQHLSFLEFNYMLLQAYDFLHLFENYNCRMQIGGADQWSNIISGVDLIRRKTGKRAIGLSIPLLTTSDGTKMGKTADGTVWLNQDLTTPFNFWQYWRNIDDRDVTKCLKLFTEMSPEEVDEKNNFVGSDKINEWKVFLADSVTSFVHSDAELDNIKSVASGVFSDNLSGHEILKITTQTAIEDVLVSANLAGSKTAAKRLIDGGGVRINGITSTNYKQIVEGGSVISVGKKRFIKTVIE
ncbi:MAG: tyrosine--tRNA ligase [Holosporales bacterium]|jgi:tyrosyl-tRNA synthetase|nr:tyrosine--tRNA ligase [Holosporales bacterium]